MGKFFSYKNRPMHLGPYPLEKLKRIDHADLSAIGPQEQVSFHRDHDPLSLVNAMQEYQAMLDATREGLVKKERAEIPSDPQMRANHLKAFGYYCDAAIVGMCAIPDTAWLKTPLVNPDVDRLAETLRQKQVKTFASGIDVIMAGLKEAMRAPPQSCKAHEYAIVFLYDYPRDPEPAEEGCDWLGDAQQQRACLRAAETCATLSNYIRLLGVGARAHSGVATDVHLGQLAVAAGLATVENGVLTNPFLGSRFGIGVVTTVLEIAPDRPLQPGQNASIGWKLGLGQQAKNAWNADPFAKRAFKDGPHPFETLKRRDAPTTYIDEPNVARVPKRADMFARALFGDLGPIAQEGAKNGNYVRKSAAAFAFRPTLGAFLVLQDSPATARIDPSTLQAARNAANLKAACYFLGSDAVGLSRCPDWAYYSHDATGEPLAPYHKNAISIIIDQGHETMEGASGDDWIACAQSMRAYLRFSLLGGVIAQQIRNLGYDARVHSVMDGEVLQPPLLLLSGLGEVSRIGEVILNPFLGPRLKSGVITTNMPMSHDRPIDFGLQKFCASCNKCARECPSGAITAGPKLMFNGYEIWKSDSQRCTTYRVSQKNGAMCGRCMKTCPWNLEGIFAERPFRWAAINAPITARALARLDDMLGNGEINGVKKWWWDLEMEEDGPYKMSPHDVNARGLSKTLNLKFEEQTLAVYPAPLAPPPYAYPYPADREAGIAAYEAMIPADTHQARRADGLATEHIYTADQQDAPVVRAVLSRIEQMTARVTKYEFSMADGSDMPPFEAGAHIDVVVAPEFLRQYSLSGDPADRSKYQIAVLREDEGRGGTKLMARVFEVGRRVFISKPLNHFALVKNATHSFLMGGGIGITPMIAMAHRLHAIGASFSVHYSCSKRENAGFLADLAEFPWQDRLHLHFSDQGSRADLAEILHYTAGAHVYTCGPDIYMQAVLEAANSAGFPDENRHMEYFSTPELPEYQNFAFTLKLAKSGRELIVQADKSATEVLAENGVKVDVKCSDGICGICKCGLISGEVEHRDFVLSNKQRADNIILCQSRAADEGGVVVVDL
ncbi:MAG: reductive dehalogenase [Alphaproteobacteria bacterium]|nr:reductive dehalogenase [Alphaproteobacteria bacterium]